MTSVGVDFDGTIHTGAHATPGLIDGPPLPGAIAAVRALMDDYAVFVCTARRDLPEVASWLAGHGLPAGYIRPGGVHPDVWESRDAILVTNRKLPAVAYVDDKGIRFVDWTQALADLARFEGR